MMPLGIFGNRVFSSANASTFCLYFSLSAILFYLPMTVITAWDVSEISAAAAFAPLSVFIGLLSATVGRLSDRYGPGPLVAAGALLAAVAFAALALTVPLRNYWGIVLPLNALLGLGMALVVSPLSTAVMGATGPDSAGLASGVNNAVSRMAGLIAVASMGSLAAIAYSTAGGTGSFGETGGDAAHRAATDAGFQAILWATAVLSLASALIAWRWITPDDTARGDKGATSHDPEREAQRTAPETPAASPRTDSPR